MDFHPLFVHFPIALLTFYSFLEIIRRFTKASYWVQVRGILVIAGSISAFVSLSTGEQAGRLFGEGGSMRGVLEVHSMMATTTTWIFTLLAASYAILWLKGHPFFLKRRSSTQKLIEKFAKIARTILETPIAYFLAILGFIGLSLTGALGAILVYGPNFDPMTSLVYKLLFGG